jgi:hypothetical protein
MRFFPLSDLLSEYLWIDSTSFKQPGCMFPMYYFGNYLLDRRRLIGRILSLIEVSRNNFVKLSVCPSVYLNGCKGMGKTSNLLLLAKSLKDLGYIVYYFSSASYITQTVVKSLNVLLKDSSIRVACLVDEIAVYQDIAPFSGLLRAPFENLVMIGAAVPKDIPTGLTASFLSQVGISDLALRKTDEDFIQLVETLSGESPDIAKVVCFHLLDYCGGHVLPTLAFIEFFLSDPVRRQQFNTSEIFLEYFNGPIFPRTDMFKSVKHRCFELTGFNSGHVSKVLSGVETYEDIRAVQHVGWWDTDNNQFISALIKNLCLEIVVPAAISAKILLTPV